MTYAKQIIAILAVLGITVDLTPGIKFQPVRYLIRQLGNLLNHDLMEKTKKIEKDLQEHITESWRTNILDFANSCMNHRRHTEEEFDNFFKDYADYETYIESNNLKNGRVENAYKYVSKIYLHCMETGDFLMDKKSDKED